MSAKNAKFRISIIHYLLFALASLSLSFAEAEIYKVRSGDTLTHIMKRHGFTLKNVADLIRKENDDFPIVAGHTYFYDSEEKTLKLYHSDIEKTLLVRKDEGEFHSKVTPSNFTIKPKTVRGEVRGSLITSISRLVPDVQVAYRFIDAYLLDLRPKKIRRGSRFTLTVERLFDNSRFIRYGDILSAKIEHQGQTLEKQLFDFGNGKVHFNETDLQKQRPFYAPVDRLKFASLFQPRRRHPITGRWQAHLGIDFEQPRGAAVYAAAAGYVEKTGRGHASGKYIVIRHENETRSYYNHLDSIGIDSGKWVYAGQKIGTVGCSGYCTKPHLHFAVKKKGRMINPIRLIRSYPRHVESQLIQLVARGEP